MAVLSKPFLNKIIKDSVVFVDSEPRKVQKNFKDVYIWVVWKSKGISNLTSDTLEILGSIFVVSILTNFLSNFTINIWKKKVLERLARGEGWKSKPWSEVTSTRCWENSGLVVPSTKKTKRDLVFVIQAIFRHTEGDRIVWTRELRGCLPKMAAASVRDRRTKLQDQLRNTSLQYKRSQSSILNVMTEEHDASISF